MVTNPERHFRAAVDQYLREKPTSSSATIIPFPLNRIRRPSEPMVAALPGGGPASDAVVSHRFAPEHDPPQTA